MLRVGTLPGFIPLLRAIKTRRFGRWSYFRVPVTDGGHYIVETNTHWHRTKYRFHICTCFGRVNTRIQPFQGSSYLTGRELSLNLAL
jgi:hypothetical protein